MNMKMCVLRLAVIPIACITIYSCRSNNSSAEGTLTAANAGSQEITKILTNYDLTNDEEQDLATRALVSLIDGNTSVLLDYLEGQGYFEDQALSGFNKRSVCLRAVIESDPSKPRTILGNLLESKDPLIRLSVISAIRVPRNEEHLVLLLKGSTDEDLEVRKASYVYLNPLSDDREKSVLILGLKSETDLDAIRIIAIKLAHVGDKRIDDLIEQRTQRLNGEDRRAIADIINRRS